MNVYEIETKLIKFCEGLFRENLLSQEELKQCRIAFKNNDTTDIQTEFKASDIINNDLKNYGMSEDQAFNNIDIIFSKNKYIICKLINYQIKSLNREDSKRIKYTLFSTEETDTTKQYLYIKNLQDLDNQNNTNYNDKLVKNITFRIEKIDSTNYVIMNYFTGQLLKATKDKKIILDSTTKTEDNYFKINKNNKYYRFESTKYPNHYIDASNPIKLTEGSRNTQNWKLDIISDTNNDELDKQSNTTFSAITTRSLIDKFLKEYNNARLNYMFTNAKIKFIEILQNKTKDVLSRNGLIMEYIRNRVNNGNLKLNEEQIMKLEANIYNEVVNNEIELLEQLKTELKINAQKINAELIAGNISNVFSINNIIDKAINKTKTQLNTLNDILDKVNSESRILNSTNIQLNQKIAKQTDLNDRSSINNKLIDTIKSKQNIDYKILTGLSIVISIMIIYLLFKVINKKRLEFNN